MLFNAAFVGNCRSIYKSGLSPRQFGAVLLPQPCVPEPGQPHPLGRPSDAGRHRLGGQGERGIGHKCHQSSAGWSEGMPP